MHFYGCFKRGIVDNARLVPVKLFVPKFKGAVEATSMHNKIRSSGVNGFHVILGYHRITSLKFGRLFGFQEAEFIESQNPVMFLVRRGECNCIF